MKNVKIANVLLEDSRQFRTCPPLYIRTTGQVEPEVEGWRLTGPAHFDFTTFFNALSVAKYDLYTVAKGYKLHIELKGDASEIVLTHADCFDFYPQLSSDKITCPASKGWCSYDFDISYDSTDVLVGFQISTQGSVLIRNSYYSAVVENSAIRDVELAVSTTTFKKETFIEHNIDLVRTKILQSDDAISKHFRMYVIDNGRTLDIDRLSGDGINVYPNRNVGGSGGFAYGMLLAQDQGDVTHILLMDDDVEVSPESIKRTYALLTIVNDDYARAFVSGAMMNFDEPDLHWEDVGYMSSEGSCRQLKPPLRMSLLHDCVTCENFEPDYKSWSHLKQQYAAWWYCCIPMSVVKDNGMPLPLFVRFDDVDYGLRCKPRFITLNGICIWHLAFYMRYNAGVERYQAMRNGILEQAITGIAPQTDFLIEIRKCMKVELEKFNYTDAELALKGFEDFLAGPDQFIDKDFAESRFMEANREREKQLPLDQLREQALSELGINIDDLSQDEIVRDIPLGDENQGKIRTFYQRVKFSNSLNGQLWGKLKPFDGSVAIIEGAGWSNQIGKLYGADTVLAINIQQKTGIIRHRDNERCRAIWKRFENDCARYRKEGEALRKSYSDIREKVTSVEYWREYLELD
jgi:galactofuranosylgalactofuranosylrhamnosyl-N-acetylglucosaminyl-diphospho-decaprenol beta-1,5/1,6-galactofuranosyltransferase